EQGFGDTLQFCRYLPLLEAKGARVVLAAQDVLRRLLKPLSPTLRIVRFSETPDHFDYHCALLSLPGAFNTRLETIPAKVPYLAADADRILRWKRRIGTERFKVGICWQGNAGAQVDMGRSPDLIELKGLSQVPGVRLISLQKNEGVEQLARLPSG